MKILDEETAKKRKELNIKNLTEKAKPVLAKRKER